MELSNFSTKLAILSEARIMAEPFLKKQPPAAKFKELFSAKVKNIAGEETLAFYPDLFIKFAKLDPTTRSKDDTLAGLELGHTVETMLGEDDDGGVEGIKELMQFSEMEDNNPKKLMAIDYIRKYTDIYQNQATRPMIEKLLGRPAAKNWHDIQIFIRTREMSKGTTKRASSLDNLESIGAVLLYDKDGYQAYLVTGADTARTIAHINDGQPDVRIPSWCIATNYSNRHYYFNSYTEKGKNPCIIVIKDGGKRKYCVIPDTGTMYPDGRAQTTNAGGSQSTLSRSEFKNEFSPELFTFFESYVNDWYKTSKTLGQFIKAETKQISQVDNIKIYYVDTSMEWQKLIADGKFSPYSQQTEFDLDNIKKNGPIFIAVWPSRLACGQHPGVVYFAKDFSGTVDSIVYNPNNISQDTWGYTFNHDKALEKKVKLEIAKSVKKHFKHNFIYWIDYLHATWTKISAESSPDFQKNPSDFFINATYPTLEQGIKDGRIGVSGGEDGMKSRNMAKFYVYSKLGMSPGGNTSWFAPIESSCARNSILIIIEKLMENKVVDMNKLIKATEASLGAPIYGDCLGTEPVGYLNMTALKELIKNKLIFSEPSSKYRNCPTGIISILLHLLWGRYTETLSDIQQILKVAEIMEMIPYTSEDFKASEGVYFKNFVKKFSNRGLSLLIDLYRNKKLDSSIFTQMTVSSKAGKVTMFERMFVETTSYANELKLFKKEEIQEIYKVADATMPAPIALEMASTQEELTKIAIELLADPTEDIINRYFTRLISYVHTHTHAKPILLELAKQANVLKWKNHALFTAYLSATKADYDNSYYFYLNVLKSEKNRDIMRTSWNYNNDDKIEDYIVGISWFLLGYVRRITGADMNTEIEKLLKEILNQLGPSGRRQVLVYLMRISMMTGRANYTDMARLGQFYRQNDKSTKLVVKLVEEVDAMMFLKELEQTDGIDILTRSTYISIPTDEGRSNNEGWLLFMIIEKLLKAGVFESEELDNWMERISKNCSLYTLLKKTVEDSGESVKTASQSIMKYVKKYYEGGSSEISKKVFIEKLFFNDQIVNKDLLMMKLSDGSLVLFKFLDTYIQGLTAGDFEDSRTNRQRIIKNINALFTTSAQSYKEFLMTMDRSGMPVIHKLFTYILKQNVPMGTGYTVRPFIDEQVIPALVAFATTDPSIVEEILSSKDKRFGVTPLHLCAQYFYLPLFQVAARLPNYKKLLQKKDKAGRTPLSILLMEPKNFEQVVEGLNITDPAEIIKLKNKIRKNLSGDLFADDEPAQAVPVAESRDGYFNQTFGRFLMEQTFYSNKSRF